MINNMVSQLFFLALVLVACVPGVARQSNWAEKVLNPSFQDLQEAFEAGYEDGIKKLPYGNSEYYIYGKDFLIIGYSSIYNAYSEGRSKSATKAPKVLPETFYIAKPSNLSFLFCASDTWWNKQKLGQEFTAFVELNNKDRVQLGTFSSQNNIKDSTRQDLSFYAFSIPTVKLPTLKNTTEFTLFIEPSIKEKSIQYTFTPENFSLLPMQRKQEESLCS
jgi:hypothetical protein